MEQCSDIILTDATRIRDIDALASIAAADVLVERFRPARAVGVGITVPVTSTC